MTRLCKTVLVVSFIACNVSLLGWCQDGTVSAVSETSPRLCEVTFADPVNFVQGYTLSVFRHSDKGHVEAYIGTLLVTAVSGNQIVGEYSGIYPLIGDIVRNTPLLDAYGNSQGQFYERLNNSLELAALIEAVRDNNASLQYAVRKVFQAERQLTTHLAGIEARDADMILAETRARTSAAERAEAEAQRRKAEAERLAMAAATTVREAADEIREKTEQLTMLETNITAAQTAVTSAREQKEVAEREAATARSNADMQIAAERARAERETTMLREGAGELRRRWTALPKDQQALKIVEFLSNADIDPITFMDSLPKDPAAPMPDADE